MDKYIVEKTVESFRIAEVLEFEPATIEQVIERVGFIPQLQRKLKYDATRRILITLEKLGYAMQDNLSKKWSKGHRRI